MSERELPAASPPPPIPPLGYAFLDNSVLAELRSPEKRTRLWQRLEALGLTLMVTELNVLQALAAGPRLGSELLEILCGVARNRWIITAPDQFLREAIHRMLEGAPPGSTEIVELLPPHAIPDLEAECLRAKVWTASADAAYSTYMRERQAMIRAELRARGVRPTPDHLPGFIAEWPSMPGYAWVRQHLWSLLGFPGTMPDAFERGLAPLRIELAAQGVGLFEYAISYDMGKPAERTDLLQLCYLGMSAHSLLISNDIGQRRAANVILPLAAMQGYALSLKDLLEAGPQ